MSYVLIASSETFFQNKDDDADNDAATTISSNSRGDSKKSIKVQKSQQHHGDHGTTTASSSGESNDSSMDCVDFEEPHMPLLPKIIVRNSPAHYTDSNDLSSAPQCEPPPTPFNMHKTSTPNIQTSSINFYDNFKTYHIERSLKIQK